MALTAMAPAFYFHKHSAKGNTLQRNYQGPGRVASHSTKTVILRSELLKEQLYDFLLPTSPGPPCVEFIWNHYQRIWGFSLYCVAVRGGKRQKTQAEGLEGRVTNCPSWPRLCSTKVLRLEKLLRPKQTRTIVQPPKEEKGNGRHCLSQVYLVIQHSQSWRTQRRRPCSECPCSKLQ